MRRFAFLAACLMAAGVLAGCGGDPEPGDTIKRQTYESAEVQFTAPAEGDTIAIFDTSAGEVRAVLYPELAPMAVDNFVGLAEQGYYNGLVFHRAESATPSPPNTPTSCTITPGRCAPPTARTPTPPPPASSTLCRPCPPAWTRRPSRP